MGTTKTRLLLTPMMQGQLLGGQSRRPVLFVTKGIDRSSVQTIEFVGEDGRSLGRITADPTGPPCCCVWFETDLRVRVAKESRAPIEAAEPAKSALVDEWKAAAKRGASTPENARQLAGLLLIAGGGDVAAAKDMLLALAGVPSLAPQKAAQAREALDLLGND